MPYKSLHDRMREAAVRAFLAFDLASRVGDTPNKSRALVEEHRALLELITCASKRLDQVAGVVEASLTVKTVEKS